MQVRGRNYLIPVDADIAREDEVAFAALDLGAVMDKLDSAKNAVNIVILDACRNNPFGNRLQASAKGLAQVDAPPGTLIAFATAPGSTAADGSGRNGLYTQHLVKEIERPGAAVEEVFKAVRAGVRTESKSLQVPWESTSLESAFSFRQKPPQRAAAVPAPGGRSQVAVTAPPAFAPGDNWTYRVVNELDKSERQAVFRIAEIHGDEVRYTNGNVGDLIGNYTRFVARGGRIEAYKPTNFFYVFPLKAGATWDTRSVQEIADRSPMDLAIHLQVVGEEDVATPLGKMRAMRVERESNWKQRDGKAEGLRNWTYWYNGGAKRFVRAVDRITTAEGKVLSHETWELVAYDVK